MYEQSELDLRSALEMDLDVKLSEARNTASGYVANLLRGEPIRNRHEGYGVLAERFVDLQKAQKKVQGNMTEFLSILPTDTKHAVEAASSILTSAVEVTKQASIMAAQAERVMHDLYDLQTAEELTPLEDMLDGDGFEDTDSLAGEEAGEAEGE